MGGSVVLVLCGLPGCGKSTLARAVGDEPRGRVARFSRVVHIEYDHVQETILSRTNEEVMFADDPSGANPATLERAPPDDDLTAWRHSRRQALDDLRRELHASNHPALESPPLHDLSSTASVDSTCTLDVIVVDDNFYWTSMRKQVYHSCQDAVPTMQHSIIYFGTIYVDTPLDVCLVRNQCRPSHRIVPDNVVQRMRDNFEPPATESSHAWEPSSLVLRLDGRDEISSNVQRIMDFVERLVADSASRVVDPAVARDEDRQRRTCAQWETRQSIRHQVDQVWRQCVSATVRLRPEWGQYVNQVRKHCLEQCHVEPMECFDVLSCLERFFKGIPSDSGIHWLSDDERTHIREKIMAMYRQDT